MVSRRGSRRDGTFNEMEFKIKQSVLKAELGFIAGIVERKSTIPVLSNLLIESIDANSIRITGTDLDSTLRCTVEADVAEQGSICISQRKISDIVRAVDCESIHFKEDKDHWVKVVADRAKFRLAGVPADHFPETPKNIDLKFGLPGDVLDYMITHTAFAITNESSRFTLSGAKFEIAGGKARMVTTDGHRLAIVERDLESKPDTQFDALVHKKALTELSKIIRSGAETVAFGNDTNHIYFSTGKRQLITRKLTGNFPNYEMVMPKDNDKCVVFDWAPVKQAVRRISLMADERHRSLRMTLRNGEVEISAKSMEEGEGVEIIPAQYEGEEIVLGFQWRYLLEFLNVVATGTEVEPEEGEQTKTDLRIVLELKDQTAPTQSSIAGNTGYDYRYILMPLRI